MAEFPKIEEMSKKVAEKALDEFLYKGKTIREWIEIIALADAISRQQVKSDFADWFGYGYRYNWFYKHLSNIPPVNPQDTCSNCCNGNQIEKAKLCQKSYLAGMEHKQEQCDDTISRRMVLDATVNKNSIWNNITNAKGENLEKIILQLPSANQLNKWIGAEVIDEIRAEIEQDAFNDVNGLKYISVNRVNQIIEKHMAESEGKNEVN